MKKINEWPLRKPTKNDLLRVEIDYEYGLGFYDGCTEVYSEKIDGIWVNVVRYPESFLPSLAEGERILIFINGWKCSFEILRITTDQQYTAYEIISALIWGR